MRKVYTGDLHASLPAELYDEVKKHGMRPSRTVLVVYAVERAETMAEATAERVNGKTFEEWLEDMDAHLMEKVELDHQCLRDRNWHDMWSSGDTPEEALPVEDYEAFMREELFG